MDELFGVADFSGLEDVGLAGKHAADDRDVEARHVESRYKNE
jgi:hypothetical protein